MNPELLEEVRNLKRDGLSDVEIKRVIEIKYKKTVDIARQLEALKYMQPEQQTTDHQPRVTRNKKQTNRKQRTLLLIGLAAFIIVFIYPVGLQRLKSQKVSQLDRVLLDKYSLTNSFHAGTAIDCVKRGPTRFGDITGIHVCSIVSAKVYYPRVEVTKERLFDDASKTFVDTDKKSIKYVDDNGNSIRDYFQLGVPIKQPGGGNPYRVDANLGLEAFEHVVFSGVRGTQVEPGENTIGEKWRWSSSYGWLGTNTPGSDLMDSINMKILADQPPAKGAPTPSEALQDDTAPLVVYFKLRYCHSPSIIFLDNFCIIPD